MSDCEHESFELGGEVEDEGDVIYKEGYCTGCGSPATAVHTRSHYLVFEAPSRDPVEVDA